MLKNLKLLRMEKGISQQKLAGEIGMSQQSINGYENNGTEPDIATLIRIADYFETTVDYIIEHSETRSKYSVLDEYAFTLQEIALVKKYRALPSERQKIVDDLLSDMAAR